MEEQTHFGQTPAYSNKPRVRVGSIGSINSITPLSPAPSPIPSMRNLRISDPQPASQALPSSAAKIKIQELFSLLNDGDQEACLQMLLEQCSREVLVSTSNFLQPMLRHDPFKALPWEISLRILSYIKDPKSLAAASQVSKLWYLLLSDDYTWKRLCEEHHFRRLSAAGNEIRRPGAHTTFRSGSQAVESDDEDDYVRAVRQINDSTLDTIDDHSVTADDDIRTENTASIFQTTLTANNSNDQLETIENTTADTSPSRTLAGQPPRATNYNQSALPNLAEHIYNPEVTVYVRPNSYRSHFRQQYLLNNAWQTGGRLAARYVLRNTDDVIVTEVLMSNGYIVISMDNSKILVFKEDGKLLSSLCGHVMGVWALTLHGNYLISGGCDRDLRVWDLHTMQCIRILHGHTSTIRCLAVAEGGTNNMGLVFSGARDNTIKMWDLGSGQLIRTLEGHTAAVRCLKISGDFVVSASYDFNVCVWDVKTGDRLHTLTGHRAQIYSLAVDGDICASGGLDSVIFVWNIRTGAYMGQLGGHVALIGQLQLLGLTLVSGSSDGIVRVWDIARMTCRHRIIAHDNAVTCLKIDEERIATGGPDGRVNVWSLATGKQIRVFGPQCATIWGLAFKADRLALVGSIRNDTIVELLSFVPKMI